MLLSAAGTLPGNTATVERCNVLRRHACGNQTGTEAQSWLLELVLLGNTAATE
jgi:hypothetical protein